MSFDLIIGFALGFADYFQRLTPFWFIHPIPLLSLISLIFALKFFLQRSWDELLPPKYLILLFFWGTTLGIVRYFLFYKGEYVYLPILRQGTAFAIGIITYQVLRSKINSSFEKIALTISLTSIIFLIIGTYQYFTNHVVGYFPRTQALFTEPSYFGDYLVQAVAPCLIACFLKWKTLSLKIQMALIGAAFLWSLNFIFVQSATAILKMGTLALCFFVFYPSTIRSKVLPSLIGFAILFLVLFLNQGYVGAVFTMALEVLEKPDMFFKYHTFYDRFYPIFATFKELLTFPGIIGHGFGGDYYEFKNLFPVSTHAEMVATKPTFSYFNSFAPKVILYLGLPGLIWIFYLFKRGFQTKNFMIKIGLMNILICTLWGVSNFSLAYVWLWLAMSDLNQKEIRF